MTVQYLFAAFSPPGGGTWIGGSWHQDRDERIATCTAVSLPGRLRRSSEQTASHWTAASNAVITDLANNRIRMVAASTGTFFEQVTTAGGIYTIAGDASGDPREAVDLPRRGLAIPQALLWTVRVTC